MQKRVLLANEFVGFPYSLPSVLQSKDCFDKLSHAPDTPRICQNSFRRLSIIKKLLGIGDNKNEQLLGGTSDSVGFPSAGIGFAGWS